MMTAAIVFTVLAIFTMIGTVGLLLVASIWFDKLFDRVFSLTPID